MIKPVKSFKSKETAVEEELYCRFKRICTSKGFFKEGDKILVALSGGADSTALLELMTRWCDEEAFFKLKAAHYHHGLRVESDAELRHVEELCNRLVIECVTGYGDTTEEARRMNTSVHAAARNLRYRFLAEAALHWAADSKTGYSPVILTGHQLDDQVETVLMRLLSGAGIDGLAGIREIETWHAQQDTVLITRPLLSFRRSELEAYCRQRNLDYVTDRSNFDLRYPRTRIRMQLLPLINKLFGSAGFEGIVRSAEVLNMARELVSVETEKALQDATIHERSCEIMLDYERFKSYLDILRFNCIKKAWKVIAAESVRNTLERCKAADDFIKTGGTGTLELGNNVLLTVENGVIYVYRTPMAFDQVEVCIGDTLDLPGWGMLKIYTLPVGECVIPPPGNMLFVDKEKTGDGKFILETARPGDRIVPFGSDAPRKVTDILREARIPKHRRGYPVIRNSESIIAVPPFRIAEPFKITSETRQVVVFEVKQDFNYDS